MSNLFQYFDLPQKTIVTQTDILEKINYLIQNDFEKLIYILYRVDVNENKIKAVLAQKNEVNAAIIIYNLLEERENEKAQTRELFRRQNSNEETEW